MWHAMGSLMSSKSSAARTPHTTDKLMPRASAADKPYDLEQASIEMLEVRAQRTGRISRDEKLAKVPVGRRT